MSGHLTAPRARNRMRGRLSAVDPKSQLVVLSLRKWLDGPDGQQCLWNSFASEIGPQPARLMLKALEAFLAAIADGADRRLSRHAVCCPCLGQDEAALADLVRHAGNGETAAATRLAHGVVRGDAVPALVAAATELGQLVAALGPGHAPARAPSRILH